MFARRLTLQGGGSSIIAPATDVVTLTSAPAGGWADQLATHQQVAQYYNGKTYFVYTRGDNGNVCVRSYDHATETTSAETVLRASLTTDAAHGSPTLLVRDSDKKIVVAYTSEARANLYMRISSNAEDVSAFAAEVDLDAQITGTKYTYIHLLQLLGETSDPLYIFVQTNTGGGTQTWGYSKSTDGGATWGAKVDFFQEPSDLAYLSATKTSETRVDILVNNAPLTFHPDPNALYHCYFEGGNFYKTDGTQITASQPFAASSMTLVYDGSASTETSNPGKVKLGADGHPRALFPTYRGSADHRWRWAKWNGSAWSSVEVCQDGWDADDGRDTVAAGGCLDMTANGRAWISRNVSGVNQVFRYVTSDDATFYETQWTTGSPGKVRPAPVWNGPSDLTVLWLVGDSDPPPAFSVGIAGT